MDSRGLAARVHDFPSLPRRVTIGVVLGLGLVVGWLILVTRSPDLPLALWWPAIGVYFVAVLISKGRRLGVAALVALAVTLSNVLGGLPLVLAIAYGVANAVEAWIVVRLLTRGKAHAKFSSLAQIGWFLISVGVGALLFSISAGTAGAFLAGADFVLLTSTFLTSHASALFALAPLALVPLAVPTRVPPWEPIVQSVALAGLTVVVFAPAQALALTFLIITTLMWGAYRLPPLVVAVQTAALAIAATLATTLGIGPFAVLLSADLRGAVFALHLFVMTHAAAALFVSGQSADWQANLRMAANREQNARQVAEDLRLLNLQKDDFISSVSHELRTPVTSILGFAELLTEQKLDVASEQASHIIHRNARRLSDVIEDVLELSQLTSADASSRPAAEIDVNRFLTECVEDATVLVNPSRGIEFEVHLPDRPVTIFGARQDLTRICSNLLSNAVKFSPTNGKVVVSMTADSESIEVRVTDEGPGIPLDEQEAVWERFYRVHSVRHSDVPGTGLGLPIVRSLVQERLGGTVELQSDGHNGTTFVVRVPRRSSRDATDAHRISARSVNARPNTVQATAE